MPESVAAHAPGPAAGEHDRGDALLKAPSAKIRRQVPCERQNRRRGRGPYGERIVGSPRPAIAISLEGRLIMTPPTERLSALWPGGDNAVAPIETASRPASLSARRVGFLWNHMFRGEEIFPLLARQLEAEFEGVEFVGFDEFGSTFGADEHAVIDALPSRLDDLGVDAVISGIGA